MRDREGFTLIELMIVVAIIGVLALIAIPSYVNLRQSAYDASARSTGKSAQTALEVYYNDKSDAYGSYTSDLSNLLAIDKNLTDDPGVTFRFLHASASGYTFAVSHAQGSGKRYFFHH